MVHQDNDTGWNSWFKMINAALLPPIKSAINKFCTEDAAIQEDLLTYSNWTSIEQVSGFLKAFHDANKATEGRTSTLELVLPAMDFLLEEYELAKTKYEVEGNQYMRNMVETGWSKMNKYYNATERSIAYIAATVLCPQWIWAYFE